jgi:polyphosphate glucokinase
MSESRPVLGIDLGGSSIKGGLVEVSTGRLLSEIASVATPKPSSPQEVMKATAVLAKQLPAAQAAGFTYPGVKRNIAHTAANVDHGWIGTDGARLASATLGIPTTFLNDADAAGIAEMQLGAGRDQPGVVIMLTFGTGIGTALFYDGTLTPNTEFGHIQMHGGDAEHWTSARVRTEENLDFPAWIARVNEYLQYIHALFWPDLFILGGAVSERYDQFAPLLKAPCEIRPAHFAGHAGIIGAALAASKVSQPPGA